MQQILKSSKYINYLMVYLSSSINDYGTLRVQTSWEQLLILMKNLRLVSVPFRPGTETKTLNPKLRQRAGLNFWPFFLYNLPGQFVAKNLKYPAHTGYDKGRRKMIPVFVQGFCSAAASKTGVFFVSLIDHRSKQPKTERITRYLPTYLPTYLKVSVFYRKCF